MASEDRRVRRSRRLLRQAFVELVLERGYAAITVEDITERADLGRATFYLHYGDKEALFDQIVTDLIDELRQRVSPVFEPGHRGFTGTAMLELFRHAAEERDAYRVVLRGEGDGRALRRFSAEHAAVALEFFTARSESHEVTMRIDAELLAQTWVGQLVAALSWWLESGSPSTPEQVTAQLLDIAVHGRYWAAGFDDTPEVRA